MATIDIQGAPGTIQWFKPTAASTRGASTGVEKLPPKLTPIDLLLDVTDATFAAARDRIVPGVDGIVGALAMTGRGQGVEARSHGSLAPVTVRVLYKGDLLVLEAIGVRVMGKPVLRISAKGDRVEMPLRVVCPMTSKGLALLNDNLGADITVDVMTTQPDIEDAAAESGGDPAPAAPRKKASKKVRIAV